MKKAFVMMAALLMMGSAAFAGGGFDIAIGPKIGYQTAKLSYDRATIKSDFSNHFTAGLFGRVTFGRVYVQPEALWFKTSNVFSTSLTETGNGIWADIPTGANVNLTLNATNIQVPVLVGLRLLDLDLICLRAQVGPTANFVIQSKTLVDYTIDGNASKLDNVPSNESFDPKTITWGLQAGVGVDLLKRITLDINYNFGLSKVFNTLNDTAIGEAFDFGNADDTKQNLFMVTVGLKLL